MTNPTQPQPSEDRKALADKIAQAGSVWLLAAGEDNPIVEADCDRVSATERDLILSALRSTSAGDAARIEELERELRKEQANHKVTGALCDVSLSTTDVWKEENKKLLARAERAESLVRDGWRQGREAAAKVVESKCAHAREVELFRSLASAIRALTPPAPTTDTGGEREVTEEEIARVTDALASAKTGLKAAQIFLTGSSYAIAIHDGNLKIIKQVESVLALISTRTAGREGGKIREPFLTADLEDSAGDDPFWTSKALELLARQLGVMNDFYYPLIGAAMSLRSAAPSTPASVNEEMLAAWNEVEEALAAATPQDIDSAEQTDSNSRECPLCNGEGSAECKTFWNYDDVALGVNFFGIGQEHVNAERLFRALLKYARAKSAIARAESAKAEKDSNSN